METEAKRGIGRREFIGAAAAALFAGVVIQITGCDSKDSSPTAPATGDVVGSISNNHPTPHSAVIKKASIDAGGAVDLDIQGAANHNHVVSLSAADMATLKAKGMVTKESASGGADPHTHTVMFM